MDHKDHTDKSSDDTTRRPAPAKPEKGDDTDETTANPPHTTTGSVTSPKFGSAVSGGAESEPGFKKN